MLEMEQLLQQSFDQSLDTERILHPVGDFTFTVSTDPTKMRIDSGISEKNQKPWARFSAYAETYDPSGEVEKAIARKPGMFVSIMLDLDESGQNISQAKGTNVDLGQFLEACGINSAGWSFRQVPGARFQGRVGHNTIKSGPKQGQLSAEIVAYTKP